MQPQVETVTRRPFGQFTAEERAAALEAARAARAAKAAERALWPPVRQPFPGDAAYLTGILKLWGVAGIPDAEPATVERLAKYVRRAGLGVAGAQEAVGMTLSEYVQANPGWPLWSLLATVLEGASPTPARPQ